MKKSSVYSLSAVVAVVVLLSACSEKENHIEHEPSKTTKIKPQIKNVDVFALNKKMKDGKNSIVCVEFKQNTAIKKNQVIKQYGQNIELNDIGEGADKTKGDGIFSGYAKIDTKSILSDVKAHKDRLSKLDKKPVVHKFSGRGIIETIDHDKQEVPSVSKDVMLTKEMISRVEPLPRLPLLLTATFDNNKSLAINDLSVVQDINRTFIPCGGTNNAAQGTVDGAWSFKTLMQNMANTTDSNVTRAFVFNWIQNWMTDQTVNGQTINARTDIQRFLVNNDGSMPWDGTQNNLNIDKLPFRLLAIMNRIDLGKISPYGSSGNAGETRLVFGMVNMNGTNNCSPMPMTVIFEYGNSNPSKCSSMKDFAKDWTDLSALPFPSEQYNAALQSITDTVTLSGKSPNKPNASAINQIRTNEIALSSPWQLREFVLDPTTQTNSQLVSHTLAQTPIRSLSNSSTLTDFINSNLVNNPAPNPATGTNGNVLCTNYIVPLNFNGASFDAAFIDYNFNQIWQVDNNVSTLASWPSCYNSEVVPPLSSTPTPEEVRSEIRQHISLNTCDDCHAGETRTSFTHINPSGPLNTPASLSGFLTGITVQDPDSAKRSNFNIITRQYDDLARRAQILESMVTESCFNLTSPSNSFFGQQQQFNIIH